MYFSYGIADMQNAIELKKLLALGFELATFTDHS
jgi:hypothetical protein